MFHWLAHHLGMDNGSGGYYLWWSGIGSDLGEIAIVGGLIAIYRRHNCHITGCWKIARHNIGPYSVCGSCAKKAGVISDVVTHDHIAQAHKEAQ